MTTFVCVHGAFRGGWSYSLVADELRRLGHLVFTPSLTGMGDRRDERPSHLGLDTWIDDIGDLLTLHDLSDVILVGHSQGGLVITAGAELCHERLSALAYIDAVEPRAGERGVDQLARPAGSVAAPLPPRGTWLSPTPLDEASGLSVELIDWSNERLCQTPLGPSLDAVVLSAAGMAVPRYRLFCERTPTGYPSVATRRRLDAEQVPYDVIDAPHDVLLSDPAGVADWLAGVRVTPGSPGRSVPD